MRNTRRTYKIRKLFNKKAGKKSINIRGNPYATTTSIVNDPRIIRPKFIPFKNSWSKFGLSYSNLPFPSSGGCVYLFLHKSTGNFYIGESIDSNRRSIIDRHNKPVSLSFRLFGNILADELVVGVLVSLVPLIVPIPIMLLGVFMFTIAVQALVFATLAGAYIGEAVEDHH